MISFKLFNTPVENRQISSLVGSDYSVTGSFAQVPNLSVAITTVSNESVVFVGLQATSGNAYIEADGEINLGPTVIGVDSTDTLAAYVRLQLKRTGASISETRFGQRRSATINAPVSGLTFDDEFRSVHMPSEFWVIDNPSQGTHTYTVEARLDGAVAGIVSGNVFLVALEIANVQLSP